jgi:hypothetical protein
VCHWTMMNPVSLNKTLLEIKRQTPNTIIVGVINTPLSHRSYSHICHTLTYIGHPDF